MEPDVHIKDLSSCHKLLDEILAVSNKQLEITRSTDMDDQALADFNCLTDARQDFIDQIDALSISIDEIRGMPEYQEMVESIQRTVKAIRDNDEICSCLMKEKMAEIGSRLTAMQTNKKARKAYGSAAGTFDPWFLDTKS